MSEKEQDDRYAPAPMLKNQDDPFFGPFFGPASGSNPRRRVTGPPPPATASKRAGAVFKRGASAFKRAGAAFKRNASAFKCARAAFIYFGAAFIHDASALERGAGAFKRDASAFEDGAAAFTHDGGVFIRRGASFTGRAAACTAFGAAFTARATAYTALATAVTCHAACTPHHAPAVATASRSSGLVTATDGLFMTCTYTIVVFRLACPSSVCTCRTSYPASSRCVAKLWRNVWHVTRFSVPAARAADRTARSSAVGWACHRRRSPSAPVRVTA